MMMREAWVAHEPITAGGLQSLKVASLGHLPDKEDTVEAAFADWAWALVVEGRGFFRQASEPPVAVSAPFAFILRPGQVYRYGPQEGERWEERFALLKGARVEEWSQIGWMSAAGRPFNIDAPTASELASLHERASVPLRSHTGNLDQAKLDLEGWVCRLSSAARSGQHDDDLQSLISTWRRSPPAAADLPKVAASLGWSYSHFRAAFRDATGLSPGRFLQAQRVDEACRRLTAGHPIKSVAYDLGFAHLESFYRAFRRWKHMTPGQFVDRQHALLGAGNRLKERR